MMRHTNTILALAVATGLAFSVLSCQSLSPSAELNGVLESRNRPKQAELEEAARKRALDAQVRKRFKLVRDLINAHEYDKADEVLATLDALTEFKEEIDDLKRLNSLARNMGVNETALAINHQRALNEAADLQLVPDSYDTVVEITPDLEPEFIPMGKLEQMLTRKISLKVSNMPLADLAQQLQELDELNIADSLNIIFSDETVKNKTFSCNFKDVPLFEIFAYISKNLGVAFSVSDHLIWVNPAPASSGYHLETHFIHLRHGVIPKVPEGLGVIDSKTAFASSQEVDTELENALKTFYEGCQTGGKYAFYPNRNLLVITDTRERLRDLEKLVHELDKPPLQAVIEARFITISESDLQDIGVEITKANGGQTGSEIYPDNQTNANVSDFITDLGVRTAETAAGNFGSMTVSGIIGNRSYDMLISAIENKNSSVIVSAPRVTAPNNRTARIRKGEKYYYFEEYTVQAIDQGDKGTNQVLVPRGKPTTLQAGITVDVKVNIGNDMQTVSLGLKPEIINFLSWEDYTSTQTTTEGKTTTNSVTSVKLPRTNEQGVSTSVTLKSGETVILGGMVENNKTSQVKAIPILGKLPLIGFLFRHTVVQEEPKNLLIFVKATIINEKGQFVVYTPPPEIRPEDLIPLKPVEKSVEETEAVHASPAPAEEAK